MSIETKPAAAGLKTDPGFERLISPMGTKETDALLDELLQTSASRRVRTWHGLHLTDEQKYRLCALHEIPCRIIEMSFPDYNHAAAWICRNQLTREDLTGEYRKYLMGRLCHYEGEGNPEELRSRMEYRLGKELGISGGTVKKYLAYSKSIEAIAQHSPELSMGILTGKVLVSHTNMIEISRLTPEEIRCLARAVAGSDRVHLTYQDIRHEVQWGHIKEKRPISRRERTESKNRVSAGIRQMPEYNPDADVNSLRMTIGSWISSIDRVNAKVDFSAVSGSAALHLMDQLHALELSARRIKRSLIRRSKNDSRIK